MAPPLLSVMRHFHKDEAREMVLIAKGLKKPDGRAVDE